MSDAKAAQVVDKMPIFSSEESKNSTYNNLRKAENKYSQTGKKFTELLWEQFRPHADEHFLSQIPCDFHARFWEMYLTCALLENASSRGYAITCPKPGPDILLEKNGQRIWIEAVTATDGDPAKADSVVPALMGVSNIPDEKIILRYTSAIKEKYDKYVKYLKEGIIRESDAYLIALNGGGMTYRWADAEMPRVLKAIFPIGHLEFVISRDTKEITDKRHQFRPEVFKGTGNGVATGFFTNKEHHGVSGIIYSNADACTEAPLGGEFLMIHNPLASQPIPHELIVAYREYSLTETDTAYELTCKVAESV